MIFIFIVVFFIHFELNFKQVKIVVGHLLTRFLILFSIVLLSNRVWTDERFVCTLSRRLMSALLGPDVLLLAKIKLCV